MVEPSMRLVTDAGACRRRPLEGAWAAGVELLESYSRRRPAVRVIRPEDDRSRRRRRAHALACADQQKGVLPLGRRASFDVAAVTGRANGQPVVSVRAGW